MEDSEQHFSAAETERMMKAQEVILKAAAGKLKWWEAAEIMGITDRTMRRWREPPKPAITNPVPTGAGEYALGSSSCATRDTALHPKTIMRSRIIAVFSAQMS